MKFSFESAGTAPAPEEEAVIESEAEKAEALHEDAVEDVEARENAAEEHERPISREEIFRNIINEGIVEDFYEALDDAGFEDEQYDEFRTALRGLSAEELSGVLSLPYELRPMRLTKLKKDIDSGKMTPADAVAALNADAKENGYTIGYHVTPSEVLKGATNGDRTEWGIRGYELDDRDNVPMAYYALDYENIYRKRPDSRFLYTVRAQTGPNSSHKVDTSNNWGRATGLSVIREFDIRDVEEEVNIEYERALREQKESHEE